ncbi:hypothetical protein B0J11DRAFT_429854, partial [Dendryphion nanum]
TTTIEDLCEDNALWYRLHVFVFDLRNFRSNSAARDRLECVADEFYLRELYFSNGEAIKLRNTIVDANGKTPGSIIRDFFKTTLEKRLKGRMQETGDWKLCAAHDLAPIFEKVFGVSAKDFSKNKVFTMLVQKGGLTSLDDGTVWKGIGRR